MRGGSGDDTIDGGDGFDLAVYGGARIGYDVSEAGGVVTVDDTITSAGVDDGTDTLTNVEFLRFNDGTFAVASLLADNVIDGTVGNDANILGTNGADIINGLDGDDFLNASSGDDSLFGGAGDDELRGSVGACLLYTSPSPRDRG